MKPPKRNQSEVSTSTRGLAIGLALGLNTRQAHAASVLSPEPSTNAPPRRQSSPSLATSNAAP